MLAQTDHHSIALQQPLPMRLLLPDGSVMNDKAKKVGLVLQGGGALGAYEAGAIKRIYELGYRPEILTGTSIGALNAAVLAAPLYGEAHETLLEMWDYLGHEHPFPLFQHYNTAYTSLGHPRFFKLHGTLFGMGRRPSIYDISPALETMQRYIDFDRLNAPDAPTVVVTATNVVSGEIERFSNRTHTLTPEHIMASGALPPSFPPIEIDGEHYWDGGIYDNTPIQSLVRILNEHETAHLPIFVIELFGALGDVPKDLGQSIDRMTELVYEDKFWKTFEGHDKAYEFAEMLWDLEQDLPEDSPLRERDTFKSLMRLRAISHIFTIPAERAALRNVIDFSPTTIGKRIESGYKSADYALDKNAFQINYIIHNRIQSEIDAASASKKKSKSQRRNTAA
ncbi:Patatin-like phospholipase [Labrenzia sp. THAF82]|nr:Patatin-like phospholipase [Labrenzia sp. THAF82]